MVFNDTRVIPARLTGKRDEVRIEVTLLKNKGDGVWTAFAKPAKRLKLDDEVIFAEGFSARIIYKHEDGQVEIAFNSSEIFGLLHKHGEMPLPPYMKRKAQASDNQNYQTVYAAKDGAVAAPTAGLHFSNNIMNDIDNIRIKRVFVTLHVGAGTFQPVKSDDTEAHIMHSEYAELSEQSAEIINQCRKSGGRVIAVGTTSLRVLESAASDDGTVKQYSAETDIFITPGYRFKAVDALLTNFHLPRSTLFMLVSAFMGMDNMKQAYSHAIAKKYRFYSYGDACLLLPHHNFP